MNRLFDFIIWGTGALIILAFLSLFAGMFAEMVHGEVISSPNMDEISFAIRLSLVTATIASVNSPAFKSIPIKLRNFQQVGFRPRGPL